MVGNLFMPVCLTLLIAATVCGNSLSVGDRVKRADDEGLASIQTIIQQHASMIETLQSEMAALVNAQQALQNHLQEQETAITALQNKQTPVAFTARYSQDDTTHGIAIGPNQILRFDLAVTNIGSGYSTETGIFTAPVSGLYVFFLQVMSVDGRDYVDLAIDKHGTILDIAYAEGSNDKDDQGSSQVTTHLTQGEQVWVRQYHGDHVRGEYWTLFTGFLIQAD